MTLQEATQLHDLTHINWKGLQHWYPQIPIKDLKKVVHTLSSANLTYEYPHCKGPGVNPRGLRANMIWQMDVTHYRTLWKAKTHICINRYIFWCLLGHGSYRREAQTCTFPLLTMFCHIRLGLPNQVKIDNSPCFVGKALQDFFTQWNISHVTGIPYSPQGQAIVERSH